MGRFFRHGELHLVLLALLAERARHGYELMRELDERFRPTYRASAGSVYPALQALAAEGLIDEDPDSDPVRYRLTSVGDAALATRAASLVRLEQRTGVSLGGVVPVENALARLTVAARDAARAIDRDEVVRLLDQTTQQLSGSTRERNQP